MRAELELVQWRRAVAELYAAVRADDDPAAGHARWRSGRDELFRTHPQSPLLADDPLRERGMPYWPYQPALRFELEVMPVEPAHLTLDTGGDGVTSLRLLGVVNLPEPFGASVGLWGLEQYAGGLFLPLRDGTAGETSYGGGRYLLDTAKGADLGSTASSLVVDLNFLYHPSCRYDGSWACPLAPRANTIAARVEAGERL